jgi:uroporphyrinogen-III synthase
MKHALHGKRVLVTRPKGQAETFAQKLLALGAKPILMPAIHIVPLQKPFELDSALLHLERFDWIVLTSVNGVEAVRTRLLALGVSFEQLAAKRLAVIGAATASALEAFCRKPDVMPAEYVAEAIVRELPRIESQRFLLARADIARPDLAKLLKRRGAEVTEVAAYHVVASEDVSMDPKLMPDFITLTSSASAKATLQGLLKRGLGAWLLRVPIVCIGPVTAATVREMGYRVAAIAKPYTTDGIIASLNNLSNGETAKA